MLSMWCGKFSRSDFRKNELYVCDNKRTDQQQHRYHILFPSTMPLIPFISLVQEGQRCCKFGLKENQAVF